MPRVLICSGTCILAGQFGYSVELRLLVLEVQLEQRAVVVVWSRIQHF